MIDTICETNPEWQIMFDELEKATTLSLLIIAAWQLARVLAVRMVEETLARRAQAKTEWELCPKCGKRLQSKGFKPRQIKSIIGDIKWKRRLGRCSNKCVIGQIAPFDEELGLASNQKSDVGLQQAACLVAIFVPFETAVMLLKQLTGINISSQAIWEWVQSAGQRMMKSLEAELEALAAGEVPETEDMSAEIAAQTLLMGADGVMVPFRPQAKTAVGKTKWREVKVAIFARLGIARTRAGKQIPRLHRHRVAAVLGDIDDLSERMWLESLKQGVKETPRVVWLSDGARGLWRLFDERFKSYAIGVLDFYHAAQNVWSGAKGWLDGRTTHCQEWFTDARHRLRHGQADDVLDDIKAAATLPGLPDSAKKSLTKLYNYLEKHRDHIQYDKFKEMGVPIGSGLVESTCKWLIQQRFKGVGMRWSEDGFNHLLHLRLAWVNGRFDAFFPVCIPSPKS
ncbi:MAG: ISKra4 family transposase [Planctomycetes bacterium]|nr:ISKra4 family transposase [Planctomycetota bacterium]